MSEGARILSARTLMTWASGPSDKFINHLRLAMSQLTLPSPSFRPQVFTCVLPSVEASARLQGAADLAHPVRAVELLPSQWRVAAKRGAPRRQTATIRQPSAVVATGSSESCLVL